MDTLAIYEKWSGQRISKEKSALFMSTLVNTPCKHGLLRITGFEEGTFPMTYLGVPLFLGRLTSCIMEPLVEKIWKKVAGWKFKLLSQGVCLILLRHVLSSMPIHLLLVLNIPIMTISRINSIIANFFGVKLMERGRCTGDHGRRFVNPLKRGVWV